MSILTTMLPLAGFSVNLILPRASIGFLCFSHISVECVVLLLSAAGGAAGVQTQAVSQKLSRARDKRISSCKYRTEQM